MSQTSGNNMRSFEHGPVISSTGFWATRCLVSGGLLVAVDYVRADVAPYRGLKVRGGAGNKRPLVTLVDKHEIPHNSRRRCAVPAAEVVGTVLRENACLKSNRHVTFDAVGYTEDEYGGVRVNLIPREADAVSLYAERQGIFSVLARYGIAAIPEPTQDAYPQAKVGYASPEASSVAVAALIGAFQAAVPISGILQSAALPSING
jgi:hypothetical protein